MTELTDTTLPQQYSIANARLAFRNFSGKEGKYNQAGKRNFCILLNAEDTEKLEAQGWNVKQLAARDETEEPQPYIQVSVAFGHIPPKIVMKANHGIQELDESSINTLDWADISEADVIFRPYVWNVNGKSGVKAYLKRLYVTLQEDEFEAKYLDVPDSAANTMTFERVQAR